jgi:Fumarase C C-terminus
MERQARDFAAAWLKSFVDRAKAFQMAGPFRLIRPTKRSNVPGPIARPDDGNDDQDGNRGWPRTYRYDHLPLERALRQGQHAKRVRQPCCGGNARIIEYVERSLMLVAALAPVICYDKAAQITHHAMLHDITLRGAALELGYVSEMDFERMVDPRKMEAPRADE